MKTQPVKKRPEVKIDFWKDNKIAGHYQLTSDALLDEFKKWMLDQKLNYLNQYPADRIIHRFLLSMGSFEKKDFNKIFKLLSPTIHDYTEFLTLEINPEKEMLDSQNELKKLLGKK